MACPWRDAEGAGWFFSRQPFANNIIPANLIDPMAKKLLSFYPLRLLQENNYSYGYISPRI